MPRYSRSVRVAYVTTVLKDPGGQSLLTLRSGRRGVDYTADCALTGQRFFSIQALSYTTTQGTSAHITFPPGSPYSAWVAAPTPSGYALRLHGSASGTASTLAVLNRDRGFRRNFSIHVSPGVSTLYVAAIAIVLRIPYFYDNYYNVPTGVSARFRP